jgi:hypothetical protein
MGALVGQARGGVRQFLVRNLKLLIKSQKQAEREDAIDNKLANVNATDCWLLRPGSSTVKVCLLPRPEGVLRGGTTGMILHVLERLD